MTVEVLVDEREKIWVLDTQDVYVYDESGVAAHRSKSIRIRASREDRQGERAITTLPDSALEVKNKTDNEKLL